VSAFPLVAHAMSHPRFAAQIACLWLLMSPFAQAQDPERATHVTVPAGTELSLELVESLDSRNHHRGHAFAMRVAEPLLIDGQLLVPAGAPVAGEVVHADRARGSGQPGELVLAARTLTLGDQVLALRGLKPEAPVVGKDRTRTVNGVAVAFAPAALMIRGGEKVFPAGSRVTAKLRDAVELPVLPEPADPGQAPEPDPSVMPTGKTEQ